MLKVYNNKPAQNGTKELRTITCNKAEKLIWKMGLSRGRIGVKFKRQPSIDKYIVDFFAPDLGIIVQIDSGSHLDRSEENQFKQRRLESMGYKVLRFNEEEVLNNVYRVLAEIGYCIFVMKEKRA